MDSGTRARGAMALLGALAAGSLFLLSELLDQHLLPDRLALGLAAFAASFFTGLLAMAGPLPIRRAAAGALAVAAAVAALLVLASLRFDTVDGLFDSGLPVFASAVVALVPLPFIVAAQGPGWHNYPVLFLQSWTVVVRYASAWLFVAMVWVLLALSEALLNMVGVSLFGDLLGEPLVAWLITGACLGLGLAVVTELSDLVSPFLVLRLLRLLLPVVLAVMVLFIVALPMQGLSGVLGRLSAATILLAMTGAAATLVSTAIDQSDEDAVTGVFMPRATQVLALLLPVPAGLAAWAVWLRADQYGVTPDRLFAFIAAGLGVGYGVLYALAVLRGPGWMERIRQGNITMALVLVAVAAVWLSPILNAEAISARNQVVRYESGRSGADALDLAALADWGRPGARAQARLEELAVLPEHAALAMRLAGSEAAPAPGAPMGVAQDVRDLLRDLLPVQPPGATAERDRYLAALTVAEQRDWLDLCRTALPGGQPGCVMVVGDFWPDIAGEEAMVLLRSFGGSVQYHGFATDEGGVRRLQVGALPGALPDPGTTAALIAALQATPPVLEPVPFRRLQAGALVLLP
ncbi:DUF4153 domain-containing protein [Paracoccaceae bacterium Fryx2]|nr:DUF4153 domain-containing protein [Paracoccaceae bacterium Fryx2]